MEAFRINSPTRICGCLSSLSSRESHPIIHIPDSIEEATIRGPAPTGSKTESKSLEQYDRAKKPMERLPSLKGLLWGILVSSAWQCFLVEAKDVCVKLPRIQIQFICDQPLLQEGFNATQIFEEFFSTQTFAKKQKQSNQTNSNSDSNINGYQVYVSVGINTVQDVSPNEYYYHRCNFDNSNQTLVTVDVRGYNHIHNYIYKELIGVGPPHTTFETDGWWMFSAPFESLKLYLSSKICPEQSFGFFFYSIHEWDESRYPMPELGESDVQPDTSNNMCGVREPYTYDKFANNFVRGGGQVVYPSSSILRYDGLPSNNTLAEEAYRQRYELKRTGNGYIYDHDLYKLCEDPAHWKYEEVDDEPSPMFWIFAVMVGYFMVFMIKAEFERPLRYEQLPRRTSRNRSNSSTENDSGADDEDNDDDGDNDGHTPQHDGQEIELMTLNNRIV